MKDAIEFYKNRVRARMIGFPLAILYFLAFGIVILICMPQIWWLSLIFFAFGLVFIICFVWYVRYTRKKIKAMEEELQETD